MENSYAFVFRMKVFVRKKFILYFLLDNKTHVLKGK